LARQVDRGPLGRGGAVAVELAAVPAGDPQVPLRVGPDPPETRVLVGRLDNRDRAIGAVDLGEVAAGERNVPDLAVGRVVDAIGATAFGILPHLHTAGGVDLAVDAVLAGEPMHPVLVERAGVEVGVAGLFGQLPDVDRPALRIVADDRVLPAVGDPGAAVGALHHPVRRRAFAERDLA